MPKIALVWIVSGLCAASSSTVLAQPAPTALGPPGSHAAPPAPAIKPGMPVSDRSGAQVGLVETVAETPRGGLNVVVKIDGKLVGLAAATLALHESRVVSSQTKREMLASAGAPP